MKITKIKDKIFEQLVENSFDKIENELKESTEYLNEIFGTTFEYCFTNENYVIYYSPQSNKYLKTTYSINENEQNIHFENFEIMKIDGQSLNETKKKKIRKIVDALEKNDEEEAEEAWKEWIDNFSIKEITINVGKGDPSINSMKPKFLKNQKSPKGKIKGTLLKGDETTKKAGVPSDTCMPENLDVLPNYKKIVERIYETAKKLEKDMDIEPEIDIESDDEGPVAIKIPTSKKKKFAQKKGTEAKKIKKKIKSKRQKCKICDPNEETIEKISQMKKMKNSGEEIDEMVIETITEYPELLYMTKTEIEEIVENCLTISQESNWDDELCEAIAEDLHKTAYNTYINNAYEIAKTAEGLGVISMEEEVSDDDYEAFTEVSERLVNYIINEDKKLEKSLRNLSSLLETASNVLENDAQAAYENDLLEEEIDDYISSRLLQLSAQLETNIKNNTINEELVQHVVGELIHGDGKYGSLLGVSKNDYDLNKNAKIEPWGHFRPNQDMDKDDYNKFGQQKGADSNPMAPKAKSSKDLDLDDDDRWSDLKGADSNPMAPKAKGQELDMV